MKHLQGIIGWKAGIVDVDSLDSGSAQVRKDAEKL